MKELLSKLEKLDPRCYDEIWQWSLWQEDEPGYDGENQRYLNHRNNVIQGACQRAVTERDWYLKQSQDSSGKYCVATIGETQDRAIEAKP